MPATAAKIGWGGKFEVNDGVGDVYAELNEVTRVQPPKDKTDVVEATHLASPNRTREYVPGLKGNDNEITFDQNYTEDELIRLYALKGVTKSYRITFPAPDTTTLTFDGILLNVDSPLEAGEVIKMTSTLQVAGEVVVGP